MELKKPCLICNTKVSQLNVVTHKGQYNPQVIMRDLTGRYELKVHFNDVIVPEVLVYRRDESLRIYAENNSADGCNTLLSHFYMPSDVESDAMKVIQLPDGICVIMPKVRATSSSDWLLVPMEE